MDLIGGNTYIISAGFYGAPGSYVLFVTNPVIIPGGGGSVMVEGPSGFHFTPDSSGTWEIRTSNNGQSDPYSQIWEFRADSIGYDDDSGDGYNVLLAVDLTAGQTYDILVGFFAGDAAGGPGSCTMTITKR